MEEDELKGKKKKGKVFSCHAIKTYKGRRGIAPLILSFGTRWRWVVNITAQLLYPGKEPGPH